MLELSSSLAGIAGQYFVAAELSQRGYVTALTLRNTKGIDLLVSNANANRELGIQVKTTRFPRRRWLLNKDAEDFHADQLFYVFVNLKGEGKYPDFSVVPSKVVAEYVKQKARDTLATPGRDGLPRKDSGIREFHDKAEQFSGGWELLDLKLRLLSSARP